ncbi:MAG TPA: hypothetical protein VLS49_01020 [Usitatibacter sp.]|nr:hypothetical protein [Usitatibacter sp.]
MLSIFRSFRRRTKVVAVKRAVKTPGSLYRILSGEFERRRSCRCSCKMPMLFEVEPETAGEPNWRVEAMWWGCRDCNEALEQVVRHYASLFDMKRLPAADLEMDAPPSLVA